MPAMHRLLLALLTCILFVLPALAEPVFPPGSRIGLVPPLGMTASQVFQGFEDREHGARLLITEFTIQTYDKVAETFGHEEIRAGGMKEIARETIGLASGEATLIVARQTENGVPMRKWALLLRAGDVAAVLIASLPEAAREAYPDAAMRAAFASVVVRAKLSPGEMMAILPYRLDDLAGFHLLRTTPDGTAVMTLGPADTTLPAQQPYFVVARRNIEPPGPADRESFARRMMAAFLNRPNIEIVNAEPVRIGGVPGYQIVALGHDDPTNTDLAMVQWLRFGEGVVQLFGIARRDRWEQVLTRMRAVRDGFGMK
jgi:hypothetical protein